MYSKNKAIVNDIESSINILTKICYENIENIKNLLNDKSIEYFILYKLKKINLEIEEIYNYIYIKFIETLEKEMYMNSNYDLGNMENLLRELNNIKVTMLTNNQTTLDESIKNFKRATQIKEDIFKILEFAESEVEKIKNINYHEETTLSRGENNYNIKEIEEIKEVDNIKKVENINMLRGSEEKQNTEENYYNNRMMSSAFMYSKESDI